MDNFSKSGKTQEIIKNEDKPETVKQGTADTAEADKREAAADLKKFKDVGSLIKAYSELEAEFTRRSQRLRELEKESKAKPFADAETAEPSRLNEEEFVEKAVCNEKVRDAVIGAYLSGITKNSPPLTLGGGGVQAPRTVPVSIKEAGRLARSFLNNRFKEN